MTVIDTQQNQVLARIKTGRGRHDITFSDNGQFVLVSNSEEGTVSVLDADAMRELTIVKTGRRPYSIDFSSKAGLAYVTDDLDGSITAIDPATGHAVARINAEPGVAQNKFQTDGRAGFVVNTRARYRPRDRRHDQPYRPDGQGGRRAGVEIAFSEEFAYIRHRGSVNIVMISLKTAGRAARRCRPCRSRPAAALQARSMPRRRPEG